ncbi:hypothetical protein L9F63_014818, partial [Diploptera punctata]
MGEEEFYSTVKPLFLFSRNFGLVPVSIFKTESWQVRYLHLIWTFIWIISLSGSECYGINLSLEDWGDGPVYIYELSNEFYFTTLSVASIINLINNIVFGNNFPKIISKFCEVDKELIPRSSIEIYRRERMSSIIDIIIITTSFVASSVGLCLVLEPESFQYYVFTVFGNLPLLINDLQILTFLTLVRKINQRLKIINYILKNQTKVDQTVSTRILRSNIIGNVSENLRETSEEQTVKHLDDVQLLQSIYITLYRTKDTINSTYSMSIVCQVMTIYITGVSSLYLAIHELSEGGYAIDSIEHFGTVSHVLLMLAWVLMNCHLACEEANSIIENIHEMTTNSNISETVQSDLKFKLLVKDMPIEFTPYGLFKLDMSFL